MKISVLCFDLSDNAAGRADLLARLLEPLGSIEVIGPRTGPGVWEPVASGPVRYTAVESRRMPGFLHVMADIARRADGDLIVASKTKLGSAGVGYLKRVFGRRPLLLDIDDWEVGFHLRSGFWGTLGRAVNLGNAAGLPWTWRDRPRRARGRPDRRLPLPPGAIRRRPDHPRQGHGDLEARRGRSRRGAPAPGRGQR